MKSKILYSLGLAALFLSSAAECATNEPGGGSSGGAKATNGGNKLTDNFKGYEARVDIPFEGETAEVLVKFTGFAANAHAKAGISALQIKDWATAKSEFTQAIVAKPNSTPYHFALGVAAEASGDFALARKEYVEANRIKGGGGHAESLSGLKRLDARQGK